MSTTHVSRLLATGAASAALALGGLATTTTPAQAAGGANATYTCQFGASGAQAVPVSYAIPTMPTTALAGVPIPQLPVNTALTLPAGLANQLGGGSPVVATVADMVVAIGFGDVGVPLVGGATATGAGPTVLSLTGVIGSINPGLAGPIPVSFPQAFNLTLTKPNGSVIGTYPCAQGSEPKAGTIEVAQQPATMKAAPVQKKVKASKSPQIEVTVTRQAGNPTGRVYAIWKGETIGKVKLKRAGGPVTMSLPKLAPGSYKIKLRYEGDPITKAASKNVKLTVVR